MSTETLITRFENFQQEMEKLRRKNGVVRFGTEPCENDGTQTWHLCAGQERHYTVKKFPGEKLSKVMPGCTACDGSCKDGNLLQNLSDKALVLLGMKVMLEHEIIVVEKSSKQRSSYTLFQRGDIVEPNVFNNGIVLKNGQKLQMARTLDIPINLTPVGTRNRRDFVFVTSVTDTITNDDGRAIVTSDESQYRAQAEALLAEAKRQAEQYEAERTNRRKDFAREVSAFLKKECQFSYEQVGELFKIAGPGKCRDAVHLARNCEEGELREQAWYIVDRYEQRAILGALYIKKIGGVPADRK